MFVFKESVFKSRNGRLGRFISDVFTKEMLQSIMIYINVLKAFNKLNKIISVECSMNKGQESFEMLLFVMKDKVIRTLTHELHHFSGICDDTFTVSPSNRSRQKTGNFNIFLKVKSMRYLYGVALYKTRVIVIGYFF